MKNQILLTLFGLGLGIGIGYLVYNRPLSQMPDNCICDDFTDYGEFVPEYYLENRDKYCFSIWVPHGGLWQEMCFDTFEQCQSELSAVPNRTNVDRCYSPTIVPAWCVNDILTGEYRTDDVAGERYELARTICVSDLAACNAMRRYQNPFSTSECLARMVFEHESETSYLTPDYELATIIQNNSSDKR